MDESSLRTYFRQVLGVSPGVSRKELRQCRDRRAQRWRMMLAVPGVDPKTGTREEGAADNTAAGRLAITNTAYDCLSNADKFRDFQSRLASGESQLPDLDSLLSTLGEDKVKPVAARVLAKRQAQLQEKMERITVLATESVIKAGHDQALKLTQGKLPNADLFYDGVYAAARDAGNRTCEDEMAELAKANLELDDTFKSELESLVVDQAEMIAHKEYDRLEDRAARSAPTPAMPRFVALSLSLIIMGLVVWACIYGATMSPTSMPAGTYPSAATPAAANTMPPAPAPGIANSVFNIGTPGTAPVPAPGTDSSAMPPAPAAGIANSVFNRTTFGPPLNPAALPVAAPVVQPGTAYPAQTTSGPAGGAQFVAVTADEANRAEQLSVTLGPVPEASVATAKGLVPTAGNAGLAGVATTNTKPGATVYATALRAALNGSADESLRGFRQAYTEGRLKEALYNEAVILNGQGKFQAALDTYNKLLANHPAFPQALYNRGLTHHCLADAAWRDKNTGEWRRQLLLATASYNLALKADPRMSQAYYNCGIAVYQLDDKERAYSDFAIATSLVPKFLPAADYNQAFVGLGLKKSTPPPAATAPPPPIGPVGPAGPS